MEVPPGIGDTATISASNTPESERPSEQSPTCENRFELIRTGLNQLKQDTENQNSSLRNHLDIIRGEVDKLKHSRLTKIAAALGIVATIFSLPQGVVTLRDSLFKSSKTAVISRDSTLALTYDAS